MLLFVIGAVDPEEMMTFIENNQNEKTFPEATPLTRLFDEEPSNVAIKERVLHMDVQKPKVYVGLKAKEVNLSGEAMLKHELSVQIALECLFGRASQFYTDMYDNGFIDESYGYDFSLENGYGFALIGSDSEHPEQLVEGIKAKLAQAENASVFTAEDVERIKRKKIGFFLRALNSIEFIANQFTRYKFNEMNLFDVVPVLETITVEDIAQAFQSIQGEAQQTVFQILPISERKA